jgi:tetratricopeptide (TPR) repeat protein
LTSSCPPREALRRLALDDPSPEEADSLGPLAVHLEECTSCRDELEQHARLTADEAGPVDGLVKPPAVRGYEIIEEIGRGGAGVVYRARQESPSRPVALKFLPGGPLAGPSWHDRAIREASAAARVRHPNVVSVHEVGDADGIPFLVMDLIEGGTLARHLADRPLAPKDAAALVEAVAKAVGFLHRRGVLHLDLKPANILLDGPRGSSVARCVPLVSDFGIARILDDSGGTAATTYGMLGTPAYMAPEQAGTSGKGVRVNGSADVYALGAILYHALTGRPPFQAPTALETLALVREAAPVPPRQLLPSLPRDLETVVMKCLERSPARRYATADDLADDLRRWLDGHPIRARYVSNAEHAWRWCGRHPAIASLAAALALTVVSGVAVLIVLLGRADAERTRAEAEHALARIERGRAEESRRRADSYEQFSARAAEELIAFIQLTMRHPGAPSLDQVVGSLLKLRESTSNLKRGEAVQTSLAQLESYIAWGLMSIGKTKDAKNLFNLMIEDFQEILQEDPNNSLIEGYLAGAFFHSGVIAEGEERLDEAVDFYERAGEIRLRSRPDRDIADSLKDLYITLIMISEKMAFTGPQGRSERPSRECKRILERLREIVRECPEDPQIRFCLEVSLLYSNDNPFSYSYASTHAPRFEDDPEAWARTIVSAVRQRCSSLGRIDEAGAATDVAPSALMEKVAKSLVEKAATRATWERRSGRIRDSRRTAEMLLAIARRLVIEFPDRADSHIVLSEAYTQFTKNAWRPYDREAIVQSMGKAIEAARDAVKLDPAREDARKLVVKLSERLESDKHDR